MQAPKFRYVQCTYKLNNTYRHVVVIYDVEIRKHGKHTVEIETKIQVHLKTIINHLNVIEYKLNVERPFVIMLILYDNLNANQFSLSMF